MKVQRVQTGLRIEKRLLKVLKGLAEHLEMPAGEVVEGILLHSFEGKLPFAPETLKKIAQLRDVYELRLTAGDSHMLEEDR